ncbi:hypothetical protein XA68_14111 [Ophiocordyceps unilateralis]|uniref:Follistatin-like domain-containing protein n=1 Tax=Ophiocordyceps unilateralis TaxID=268505 RepID=A0A2A9PB28_OPHUN|nr:hypothetical protein XA68_14111 [Ophiocordyceps unilateralis]
MKSIAALFAVFVSLAVATGDNCPDAVPCLRRAGCTEVIDGCVVCKPKCRVGGGKKCPPPVACLRRSNCIKNINGCVFCKPACRV